MVADSSVSESVMGSGVDICLDSLSIQTRYRDSGVGGPSISSSAADQENEVGVSSIRDYPTPFPTGSPIAPEKAKARSDGAASSCVSSPPMVECSVVWILLLFAVKWDEKGIR